MYLAFTSETAENKLFQYILGRQPSDGVILYEDTGSQIMVKVFLDSRYFENKLGVTSYELSERFGKEVIIEKELLWGKVSQLLDQYISSEQAKQLKVVGPISHQTASNLQIKYPSVGFDHEWSDQQRMIKTDLELGNIRQAIEITEQVYAWLVDNISSYIGKPERAVRVALLDKAIELGAEWESFPAIVASGANAALPHHASGNTLISEGPLLIDMGFKVGGYCSDFTRTFWVSGETRDEREDMRQEFESVLKIVKEAHRLACAGVSAGVSAGEIDRLARDYITEQGYGDKFGHSTGHGVGLNIHELPHVSMNTQTILESGMVLTVEPGIYLPGKFGVRWEDIVIVP